MRNLFFAAFSARFIRPLRLQTATRLQKASNSPTEESGGGAYDSTFVGVRTRTRTERRLSVRLQTSRLQLKSRATVERLRSLLVSSLLFQFVSFP